MSIEIDIIKIDEGDDGTLNIWNKKESVRWGS